MSEDGNKSVRIEIQEGREVMKVVPAPPTKVQDGLEVQKLMPTPSAPKAPLPPLPATKK